MQKREMFFVLSHLSKKGDLGAVVLDSTTGWDMTRVKHPEGWFSEILKKILEPYFSISTR